MYPDLEKSRCRSPREAEFTLSDEQKSLPFLQSFVTCCQRIMLLPCRSLLWGYNILALWFGYCLPFLVNFSK